MKKQPAIWTLVLLAGCSFDTTPHWSDQLEPSGPCWKVNLVDGMDETSTQELHDLFDCLNKDGNVAALTQFDDAMDAESRTSEPVGISVAKLTNALPTSGYDLFGVAGKLLQLIEDYSSDANIVLESVVEAIYGVPYDQITGTFDLGSESNLERGILVPAIDILSDAATQLQDSGPGAQDELIAVIDSEAFQDGICTLTGIVQTSDPEIQSIGDDLMRNLGRAWSYTSDTSNNLWSGPHDNSVRDLLDALDLSDDNGAFAGLKEPLLELMNDDQVQLNTVTVLQEAAQEGHLAKLPTQILYLASVDSRGADLSPGTPSALQAGARLLHSSNTDVNCSIDLPVVPSIEFSLGNLAVEILRQLANLDQSAAVDSVDLLGDILGSSITQTILNLVVDAEVCPAINDQFIGDLKVLERLNDPEVGDLVSVLHGMLDAVYREGEFDRLPETVQLFSSVHTGQLLPPVEEVLRDLESSEIMGGLTKTVETIIDPSMLYTEACPADSTPLNFNQVWGVLVRLLEDEDAPNALLQVLVTTTADDPFWTLVENTADLTTHETARIHELPDLLVEILATEDEGIGQDAIHQIISNTEVWQSALNVMENQPVIDALTKPTDDTEGPLPFIARLITTDTVTVMLQTLTLLLDSLGAEESTPS